MLSFVTVTLYGEADIYRLYLTGDHSDITIVCAAKQWRLHRCILSASSGYFKLLCGATCWRVSKEVPISMLRGQMLTI
jgi:hypothetical protein